MTYSSASDVAMYCPELVDGGTTFTTTTKPTLAQVNKMIDRGYSAVNARLAARGYAVPVLASADAYETLTDLEALYAASRAQLVRMTSRMGPEDRPKSEVFREQFEAGMRDLLKLDLSAAGLSHTSGIYTGGISEDAKQVYEDDSDRVAPRFRRDQFRYAGTQRPAQPTQDTESE